MKYCLSAFRRYADFQGRATRTEYWLFLLVHVLVLAALITVAVLSSSDEAGVTSQLVFLPTLYLLGTALPVLALGTRRMHDRDWSGALQFLLFVPFGTVVVLILMALPGRPGPNQYGPDTRSPEYRLAAEVA